MPCPQTVAYSTFCSNITLNFDLLIPKSVAFICAMHKCCKLGENPFKLLYEQCLGRKHGSMHEQVRNTMPQPYHVDRSHNNGQQTTGIEN